MRDERAPRKPRTELSPDQKKYRYAVSFFLLRGASAAQGVVHVIVPFMACVFVYLVVFAAPQREGDRPGFSPGLGIINRELITERVGIGERKMFCYPQCVARRRIPDRNAGQEVRRF